MDSDLRELSPIERYERRTAHFLEQVKRLEAQSRGYSNLRLAIFVVGVISVVIVPKNTAFWILLLTALLLLLLVLFIAAAIRHQLIEGKLETGREMARRNEEGKARISRNWKDLPDRSPPGESVSSQLARDLDLFAAHHYSIYLALQTHGKAETRLPKPCCMGSKGKISQIDTLPSGSWRRG
jgi:hypothetical protein